MGYRQWRERILGRIEAAAEGFHQRAEPGEANLAQQRGAQHARRAADSLDRAERWYRQQAAVIGEDHDDLLARAEPFGLEPPQPPRSQNRLWGSGSEHIGPYEHWRDLIVIEEARG